MKDRKGPVWLLITLCLGGALLLNPKASEATSLDPAPPGHLAFAQALEPYLGIPYRLGGATKRGMDCSGFVRHVYRKFFNLELPHSSALQYALPYLEKVSRKQMRPGDLVFFATGRKRVNHVGVCLSEGRFIHAIRKKGVTISSLDNPYWRRRLVGVKRIPGLSIEQRFQPDEDRQAPGSPHGSEQAKAPRGLDWPLVSAVFSAESSPSTASWKPDLLPAFVASKGPILGRELQWEGLLKEEMWNMQLSLGGQGLFESPPSFLDPDPLFQEGSGGSEGFLAPSVLGNRVSVAREISASPWLKITPSVAYQTSRTEGKDPMETQGPAFGVELRLLPLRRSWSMSASLLYAEELGRSTGLTANSDPWTATHWSMSLGFRMSDGLQFRLTAERSLLEGISWDGGDGGGGERPEQKGLYFSLDWRF